MDKREFQDDTGEGEGIIEGLDKISIIIDLNEFIRRSENTWPGMPEQVIKEIKMYINTYL